MPHLPSLVSIQKKLKSVDSVDPAFQVFMYKSLGLMYGYVSLHVRLWALRAKHAANDQSAKVDPVEL